MHTLTWEPREDGGYRGLSRNVWIANVRQIDWHPGGHWAWTLDVVRGSRSGDVPLQGEDVSENAAKDSAASAWSAWCGAAGLIASPPAG